MKMRNKLLFLLPLIALTSCGYGLKDAVYGNKYNSPVFKENYYDIWDSRATDAFENRNTITPLDYDDNLVFTRYGDSNFVDLVDPARSRTLKYANWDFRSGNYYGNDIHLTKQDETFKYGYISKLFDGRMFCGGKYQLSRVQINEKGFGSIFKKEMSVKEESGVVPYFAMNFKASVDYTKQDESGKVIAKSHSSDIKLNVTLFTKNTSSGLIDSNTYSYTLNNLETNYGDHAEEGGNIYDTRSNYVFFGFSLEDVNCDRCVGMAITYELLKDEFSQGEYQLDYSLMLYEVFFVNVNWN